VRDAFARALGRFPALLEALVGLAAIAVVHGHVADAMRFFRMADAQREPPFVVPQPAGAGSWYVPATACRLLSPVDPTLARRFFEEAEHRGCPAATLSAMGAGFEREQAPG